MQARRLEEREKKEAQVSRPREDSIPFSLEGEPLTAEILKESSNDKEQVARDNHDKYLRIYAEFENYKKRVAKERETLTLFSNEVLIGEILPFIDNLERAMEHASSTKNESVWTFIEGVRLALKDLLRVLGKYGLEPIKAVGQPFDPKFHDAVSVVHSDSHPPNTVIDELRKGYILKDRLLRPSRVVVALMPEPKAEKQL